MDYFFYAVIGILLIIIWRILMAMQNLAKLQSATAALVSASDAAVAALTNQAALAAAGSSDAATDAELGNLADTITGVNTKLQAAVNALTQAPDGSRPAIAPGQ